MIRQTIGLSPALILQIDVIEVEQFITAIPTHSHRDLECCPHCAGQIWQLINLYRGRFLAGLAVASPAFDEWQRTYEDH